MYFSVLQVPLPLPNCYWKVISETLLVRQHTCKTLPVMTFPFHVHNIYIPRDSLGCIRVCKCVSWYEGWEDCTAYLTPYTPITVGFMTYCSSVFISFCLNKCSGLFIVLSLTILLWILWLWVALFLCSLVPCELNRKLFSYKHQLLLLCEEWDFFFRFRSGILICVPARAEVIMWKTASVEHKNAIIYGGFII